jgi:hypothetical protein
MLGWVGRRGQASREVTRDAAGSPGIYQRKRSR